MRRLRIRVWLIGAVVLAASDFSGRAQDSIKQPAPQQEPAPPLQTLRLQTKIVGVAAVVRDKQGRPVPGLTKDDFALKQDGQPQEIRYFSQGSDLPLTLALLVDTSGSQRTFIADETAASMIFFRAMLTRPEDRASLVQFDTNVLQLQPLTSSVDKLQRQLGYLSYPHKSLPASGGGTLLYDAMGVVADKMLGKEQGRRAMVLLTDGGDNGSSTTLDQAIASALQADLVVYSIFYSVDSMGAPPRGFGPTGRRDVLEKISNATGGSVFDVNRNLTLREIYGQIAEDMRLQYQLGYRAPDSAPGLYHKIDLKTKDKKLTVQARKGYYSPKE